MTLVCTKCGEEKDCGLFAKDKQKKHGYRRECKECVKKRNPNYWKNKERLSVGYKRCRQCFKAKYETEYHKDPTKSDGLYSICKDCRRSRTGVKKNENKNIGTDGYKIISGQRQHRLILERILGRKLKKHEVVHHKNGNKLDNNIANLEILTPSQHATLHLNKRWDKVGGKQGREMVCTKCGKKKYHTQGIIKNLSKTEYMCQKCYYKSKKWLKNLTKQDYIDRGKKACLTRWGNKKRT